jgi:RNase P/RNase MRP subunit POP5
MRLKHTYFICELAIGPSSSGVCSAQDLFTSVRRLFIECFGDAGWGRAAGAFAIKHLDSSAKLCVIRGGTETRQQLHVCLALVKAAGGIPVALRVRSISSTIRTLQASYSVLYAAATGKSLIASGGDRKGVDAALFWSSLEDDATPDAPNRLCSRSL